jgi:hypothetical protein
MSHVMRIKLLDLHNQIRALPHVNDLHYIQTCKRYLTYFGVHLWRLLGVHIS